MKITKARKRKIVARMIELLDRRGGWVKGAWVRPSKGGEGGYGYCLLGAARKAYEDVTGMPPNDGDMGRDVAEALSLVALIRAKSGGKGVAEFNDHRKTKKADVLAILREKQEELATS